MTAAAIPSADELFDDFTGAVTGVVADAHGLSEGMSVWREEPVGLPEFVESPEHLGLPPLFPRQLAAARALLGDDPKLIFEEPRNERIPLAWVTVKSSNVRAVGWHDGALYCQYRSGGTYAYHGVERETFEALLAAKSPGRAMRSVAARAEAEKLPSATVEIEADWQGRRFQVAVLLWGKGSGKDYLSSVLITYLLYVLLCLRDPQGYFEFARGEPIDVLNVAYNAEQAKRVFFEKLKQRLYGWKWLYDRFNIVEGGRPTNQHVPGRPLVQINDGEVIFPRQIRAFSRHSENESYEGMNVVAWVMDEASAFLSKLKRENADRIYQTLRTSAASRFQRRWVGFIISYPRHGDDFTMTKLAEAVRDPRLGLYGDGPASTWEVNERLGRGEFVEVRPGHSVPVELANDYLLDYEEAKARYECDPPAARDAFFKFPERLEDAVAAGRKPLIEWEPTVTRRTVVGADGEEVTREYAAVKITRMDPPPRGAKFYFHGDPGLTNDSFALAIGHGVPATIMVRVPAGEVLDPAEIGKRNAAEAARALREGREPNLIEPDTLIEWERDVSRTIIDAVIVWRPDPRADRQVDLLNVEQVLMDLREVYRLGHKAKHGPTGTFDHWNSAEAIQRMQAKKMNVEDEAWSRPYQLDLYKNARRNIYNDLVTLPDTPSITSTDPLEPGALYELKRIELIEGNKVDHPEGGSKDIADAVVRVIQHVTEAGKSQLAFGTAFGHRDRYKHLAPYARPTETPRANPAAPPKMATERAIDAERERRALRPFGEISPSDGTVDGRRLAFGSIPGR